MVSPSNQAETWSNVSTYTSISSAREILVLHSTRIGVELLQRSEGGAWPERTQEVSDGGELALARIGFRVSLTDLYRRTGLTGGSS